MSEPTLKQPDHSLIPPEFQPGEDMQGLLSSAFGEKSGDVARLEQQKVFDAGVRGLMGGEEDSQVGQRLEGSHQGVQGGGFSSGQEEGKEAERTHRYMRLLLLLDQKIADLDWQIEQAQIRYNELDGQENALEAYLDRLQRGEDIELDEDGYPLDEEVKAAIKAYEEEHNVEVDPANPEDVARVLKDVGEEKEVARSEIEAAEAEKAKLQEKAEPFRFKHDVSEQEISELEKILEEVDEKQNEITELREDMRSERGIEPEGQEDEIASVISVEDEIEGFMMKYAESQHIEDSLQRLAYEQDLVSGLSEEALLLASFQDDTAHLFEEDYFEPLKTSDQADSSTGMEKDTIVQNNLTMG